MRSSDPAAMKFVESSLRGVGERWIGLALRAIAAESPRGWWSVVVPWLEHRDAETREEAARTLEALAVPQSAAAIKKRWRTEDEAAVKGRLLRAWATCAPTDKAVVDALTKTFDKDRESAVRVQAAVAASFLEIRDGARALLGKALADEEARVRAAAAYAIASRRDPALVDKLDAALKSEQDDVAREWMTRGVSVVREDGDLRSFANFVRDVLGDERPPAGAELGRGLGGGR
jgi:hypothetical protein